MNAQKADAMLIELKYEEQETRRQQLLEAHKYYSQQARKYEEQETRRQRQHAQKADSITTERSGDNCHTNPVRGAEAPNGEAPSKKLEVSTTNSDNDSNAKERLHPSLTIKNTFAPNLGNEWLSPAGVIQAVKYHFAKWEDVPPDVQKQIHDYIKSQEEKGLAPGDTR